MMRTQPPRAHDAGMDDMLVIGRDEIRRLLPMERRVDLVEETLPALAPDEAVNPLRRGTASAARDRGVSTAVQL